MRLIVLTACLFIGSNSDVAIGAPSIEGVWQSDGYGFVLEIRGESARLFSIGDGFCVPETDEMVPITDLLPEVSFELMGSGQRLNIGLAMEQHRISAYRRSSVPRVCTQALPADAITVFNAFVGYFDTNYLFFTVHNVDWPARVAEARQRMDVAMSDQELFDELSWLIAPLRDGHVTLVAELDGSRVVAFPGRAQVLQNLRNAAGRAGEDPADAVRAFRHNLWYQSIPEDVLGRHGQMVGNDRIQFGMLGSGVGYLAFAALDGFGSDTAMPEENLSETQSLLDDIMIFFENQGAQSVVLDLSLNFGGSDYIAREIASRFLSQTVVAYTKFAGDAVRPIVTGVSIEPSARARFDGDVILLTSQVTVSAAEVLALSLRSQSHVMHVGEATRGALSDALSRSLPNGWQLTLSNEVYLDFEGRHWEAVGIPPEIERPVFQGNDPIGTHLQTIRWLLKERI